MTNETESICPACNGNGWIAEHSGDHYYNSHDLDCSKYGCPVQIECEECSGTGHIKSRNMESKTETILHAEAGKMVDNKVMLQRAYGWLRSHYPNVEVLHLQVEVMASYMARFAQEQIKSATILTPEQEEAKLKEAFEAATLLKPEIKDCIDGDVWLYPTFNDWRNRK